MDNKVKFVDNNVWEYDRFYLEERNGSIWYVDVEGDWEEEVDLVGGLKDILSEGEKRGFWWEEGKGVYYYEFNLDKKIMDYLGVWSI